jgi:hypothetical protein
MSMFGGQSRFDPGAKPERADELRPWLAAISDVAPGAFATVKRQASMLNEQLDADAWIEQLAAEAKATMLELRRQQLGVS